MSFGQPVEGPPGGPYLDPVRQDLHIIKCVVVGDSGVGKTRLVCARACNTTYTIKQLMQTHCPTVWAIDHYRKDRAVLERSWCVVDGVTVSLRLWDTFGYHDKDRRFAYGRADVILVCFSVVRPRTLRSVVNHWIPEVHRFCPGIPVIVCGCQADLRYLYMEESFIKMDKGHFFREINDSDVITPDKARHVAEELGAYYYETSVARPYGIDDVFTNVIRASLVYKRDRNFWNILGNLKRIRRPVCQQPLLPPAPAVPSVAVPPPHLSNDLGRLLENQAFCDVIFVVQGVCIPAHRVCLVAGAQVFQDLFCSEVASPVSPQNPTTPSPTSTCPNPAATLAKLHRSNSKHSKGSKDKDGAKEKKTVSDTAKLLDNEMTGDSAGNTPTHTVQTETDANANTASQTRVLNHTAFRKIHIQQHDDPYHPGSKLLQAVVDLDDQITPAAFQYVLDWLYTGSHPYSSVLTEVRVAAHLLGLRHLSFISSNMITNENFLNPEVDDLVNSERTQRIKDLCITQSLLSDVEFQVDDGIVRAHRALLMVRCDVMYGMFSYNFKESSAKLIPFPGVTVNTFKALQEYLYTGSCNTNCIELIELANRLCLSRLLAICEHRLIQELQEADKEGNDIIEDVMLLLEPAQLHNASQLAEWILWFLSCHYRTAYRRFPKILQQLKPENQIYLSKHRWPPVWYLKELDYYEKCLIELERETKLQPYNRRNSDDCTQSGCLGFCSRNRRKLNSYEPSPTAAVAT